MASSKLFPKIVVRSALIVGLSGIQLTANAAGPMDFLFTSGRLPKSETGVQNPRGWKFSEFGALRLVAKEAGSAANQQPAALNADALRMELARIELVLPSQQAERLFSEDELKDLVPSLVKALASAGPGDDVLMVSSARRGSGFVAALLTLTARIFIQDGAMQIIVKNARNDVYTPFKITGMPPDLEFGSRGTASDVSIRHPSAKSVRVDWVALILGIPSGGASPKNTPVVAPQLPLSESSAQSALPSAAPATSQAQTRDPAFFEQQELRLKSLKRLFDQGLIKEDEYLQKRQEILRSL